MIYFNNLKQEFDAMMSMLDKQIESDTNNEK